MARLETELDRLLQEIGGANADTRHRYQPKLRSLMRQMELQGDPMPPTAKSLHEELVCEAIEAQFDNVPV